MGREYKIKWERPAGHDAHGVLIKLPSPIAPGLREIYNYSVLEDGFYFFDHLVDPETAGMAFKLFVDEALSHCQEVTIEEI